MSMSSVVVGPPAVDEDVFSCLSRVEPANGLLPERGIVRRAGRQRRYGVLDLAQATSQPLDEGAFQTVERATDQMRGIALRIVRLFVGQAENVIAI